MSNQAKGEMDLGGEEETNDGAALVRAQSGWKTRKHRIT